MKFNLFRLAFPVAISYFFLSISFSLLAKSSPLGSVEIALLSLWVYAGAAQFVAVELFKTSTWIWEITLTTLIINSRMWVYSFIFLNRIKQLPLLKKISLLIGITDENYLLFSLNQDKKLVYRHFLAVVILLYLAWNAGTLVGIHFIDELPWYVEENIHFLYYLLFIILFFEAILSNKIYFFLALITMGFNFLFRNFFNPAVALVLASLLGSLFFTLWKEKKPKKQSLEKI